MLRRIGRAGIIVLLTLVAIAAGAPAAGAAKVRTLAPSQSPPSAITDGAGTLHVAWETVTGPGEPHTVSYCRVATGPPVCTQIGGFPSFVFDVHLLQRPQDGALWLIVGGADAGGDHVTFALGSGDNGASWSAPSIVGRGIFDLDNAVLTPDGQAVDTVDDSAAPLAWQQVPLTGGTETRVITLGTAGGYSDDADLLFRGGRPMLLAHATKASRFRVLRPGADPYADASWTPWSAAPGLRGISSDAAQGPRGILALSHSSIPAGQTLRIWRLGRHRWRPLRRRNTVGSQLVGPWGRDVEQDARGRIHLAWADTCGRRGRFCINVRHAARRHFLGRTRRLRLSKSGPQDLSVAVNARGRGWLVWRGLQGSPVRVARMPR
jgi:hypothetical protein